MDSLSSWASPRFQLLWRFSAWSTCLGYTAGHSGWSWQAFVQRKIFPFFSTKCSFYKFLGQNNVIFAILGTLLPRSFNFCSLKALWKHDGFNWKLLPFGKILSENALLTFTTLELFPIRLAIQMTLLQVLLPVQETRKARHQRHIWNICKVYVRYM